MKQNGSHCLHFARTLVSFGKQNVAISYFILLSAPLTDQCLSNADFSSGHVQKDSATLSSRSALSHISLITDSKDVLTSQPEETALEKAPSLLLSEPLSRGS